MQPTIPLTIFEVAEQYPFKKALMYKKGEGYVGITYRELVRRVKDFSSTLLGYGIKKGDRVAILSSNRTEWVIADLAIMYAGAIVVPVHTTLSPKIIKHILQDSGSRVLIVNNQQQLNKVILVEQGLKDLEKIIYLNLDNPEDVKIGKKLLSWSEAVKEGKKLNLEPKCEINHNDICSIVYTSGTTGLPKGVMLTHYNFLSNARAALDYVPVNYKDVLLSFLPLSHVLERTAGYYAPLSRGCTIVYAESIKTLPKNLKEVRPTVIISVPRIFEKMFDAVWEKVKKKAVRKKLFVWALKQEKGTWKYFLANLLIFRKVRSSLGGRLRLTISGGATLNEKIAKFFSKMGILILEGYGLTETSPIISVNKENKVRLGSVGVPLMGIEVKTADDKEILVRSHGIMKGYFHNEAETKLVIDDRGWLHTGDLGFIDGQGFLFVIGRRKEMIVTSGGKNVWPEVLENALNADRFILQSMVVGHNRRCLAALIVPDLKEVEEYLKERKICYQSLEDLLEKPEIISLFQERLNWALKDFPDYEKIHKFALLKDEFMQKRDELTPTLKLRREVIEMHNHKEIERMYEE